MNYLHAGGGKVGIGGQHQVSPTRQALLPRQTLQRPSAHDHRVTHGQLLESPQIGLQGKEQPVLPADGPVFRYVDNGLHGKSPSQKSLCIHATIILITFLTTCASEKHLSGRKCRAARGVAAACGTLLAQNPQALGEAAKSPRGWFLQRAGDHSPPGGSCPG